MIEVKIELLQPSVPGVQPSQSWKYDDAVTVARACKAAGQDARSGLNIVYRVTGVKKPCARFFEKVDNHIKYGD